MKRTDRLTPEARFSVIRYTPMSRKWRAGVALTLLEGELDGMVGASACALGRGIAVNIGPRWVYLNRVDQRQGGPLMRLWRALSA